jgi:uncharacterized repeat protein (TIGR01451 family)
MKRSTFNRIPYSIVLAALLLSAVAPASVAPAATPVPAQAPPQAAPPQAPPPPGGATRFLPPADPPSTPPAAAPAPLALTPEAAEVEEPGVSSPAAPAAPQACSSGPQKATFGQDLELFLGPRDNFVTQQVTWSPGWSAGELVGTGPITNVLDACTSSGPGPEQAYLWRDYNYTGNCRVLNQGMFPSAASMGNVEDEASSLKVGKNVELTLCRDPDYTDVCQTFAPGTNVPDMRTPNTTIGHDNVSSAKLYAKPVVTGNLSVAAWGTDRTALMLRTIDTAGAYGPVVPMSWDAQRGGEEMVRTTGSSSDGSPIVVNLGLDLAYVVRSSNKIYARESHGGAGTPGNWNAWRQISSIGDAKNTSDPVAVATDIYNMYLFYVTTGGEIKLTQWGAGADWWATPISLGKPTGTTFVEVNAVARDQNHLAVFGVGANGNLYVKMWSNANYWDWSDVTTWEQVASSVKTTIKPGLASRHTGHIGVTYLSTATNHVGHTNYREWSGARYVDKHGSPYGWFDTVDLGGVLDTTGLVATDSNQMFAYGVNSVGDFYTKDWTEGSTTGTWGGWARRATGWATGQTAAAVSTRPHDVNFYGRNTSNKIIQVRYSNLATSPSVSTIAANTSYGKLNSQGVAMVQGKTYWFSAYLSALGRWTLEARNTQTWTPLATFDMSNVIGTSSFADFGNGGEFIDMDVADVDRDGDDEVLVAISHFVDTDRLWNSMLFKLTFSGSTPVIVQKGPTGGRKITGPFDVNVALGDLDGDGNKDEFAVAWHADGSNQFWFRTYRIEPTTYSFTSLTGDFHVDIGDSWDCVDRDMTIGQVDGLRGPKGGLAEQVILSVDHRGWNPELRTFKVEVGISTPQAVYTITGSMKHDGGVCGAYSSALAAGDVDGDGFEEAVFTWGAYVQAIDVDTGTWSGPYNNTMDVNDNYRYMTVGDVDGDGKAEIVYARNNDTGYVGILKVSADRAKLVPGSYATDSLVKIARLPDHIGMPLLADLDGDSATATRTGCQPVTDVKVVGVINAQPLWHNGSSPDAVAEFEQTGDYGVLGDWQYAGGGMANSNITGTQNSDGWHTNFGASLTLGIKHEVNAPVLGFHIGEVRASVTAQFEGSFGGSKEREESWTTEDGVDFGSQAFGHGAVCATYSYYECYAYEIVRGVYTSTAVNCLPNVISGTVPICKSLEDWYSTNTRQSAGNSWVAVGHHPPNTTTVSNDINWGGVTNLNYPARPDPQGPPGNPAQLWWVKANAICVNESVNPKSTLTKWSLIHDETTRTNKEGSLDANVVIAAGADVGLVTWDASVTVGAGGEWSSGVSWGTSQEVNGSVFPYKDPALPNGCAGCSDYWIKPFIYKAKAKTQNGFTYDYLEQDYYVTSYATCPLLAAAASQPKSIVGLTPQAPIVTSPTHPDPATWYPSDTVTFNWSQPAGDTAQVVSYRWNIDHSPVITPTALDVMTTTHTYEYLPDGLYYLHIQAVGDTRLSSPVTHRAFRVDRGAPDVTLLTDPSGPAGSLGWYNTPVTVTVTAAEPNGSGVAGIEINTGTAWQPYSAPILITADTPGRTLSARATDNLGHVSDPISITLKLDQTPPSVRDKDRYGLSYARLITDEVGNAQLVLGGAISDALSGRLQVEVKAGETGAWNLVSEVGDLPMPPGNWFSTTMTSLQWMYTPTFEIRGAYPLYVRGLDVAGNYGYYYANTLIMPTGCFWWDPVADPALDESRVSVWPHQAKAGDVVVFTIAARNSGYQEAQYRITDTVPVGLTVLPDSISEGGQYDAATRQIVWTLHALWPAQTRYLFFKATADSATTVATLENKLDLMSYWPWDRTCDPRVPPEPARHTYSTSTTLTVLPGASVQASAASLPQILDVAVVEGEVVSDPDVTLLVNASRDARFLYVKEWVLDASATWSLASQSGWVPFEAGAGLTVSEDDSGKYGRYQWTLSNGDGVKYLGIWVADADGQTSNLNEANLIYTNLLSAGGQQLAAGGRTQYRMRLRTPQLAVLTLVSLIGDADLYVWKPRAGLKPHYYSNAVPSGQGLSVDSVAFYAPEEGLYVIEVEAATDAIYRLVTAGDISGAGLQAQTEAEALPASTHLALADKERPEHPLTLTTPFSLGNTEGLPTTPAVPKVYQYYLPVVYR